MPALLENMTGCESNEVLIRTLAPGACFELTLSRTTSILGIVLEHAPGSTVVNTGRKEHWCSDAPVIPHLEATDSDWLLKSNSSEDDMTDKEKKARKVKTPKAPVEKKVTLFAVTAKESKEITSLLDEKNDAQHAIIYRAISEHGPTDFDGIWSNIYRRFQASKAHPDKIKTNVRTYIHRMVKAGMVKRLKKAVEESAKVAAA